MIAQVIVDVAARQTDRIFEYHIPTELEKDIAIGSRVVVPFGPRKVQGFVVGITDQSEFKGKLKDLLVVVDEMPPLTPELVKLSADLAKNIFSYRIKILQWERLTNNRKLLVKTNDRADKMQLFQYDQIDLIKITDLAKIMKFCKLLQEDQVKIEYVVENRAKKKIENQYELALKKEE